MDIKLKLQIGLKDYIWNDNKYVITLRFLEIDDRFDPDFNDDGIEQYSAMNGMDIIASNVYFLGNMLPFNKFYIPRLDKIGMELRKTFNKDEDRYLYLKNLYVSLHEWSNYWYGFYNDPQSSIEIIGDKWIIGNL